MRKPAQRALILAVGFSAIVMLIAGCEENASGTRAKLRFEAHQNRELKKEIERQKELVAECEQERKKFEKEAGKDVEELMQLALDELTKENQRLLEENEKLKQQLREYERNRK